MQAAHAAAKTRFARRNTVMVAQTLLGITANAGHGPIEENKVWFTLFFGFSCPTLNPWESIEVEL